MSKPRRVKHKSKLATWGGRVSRIAPDQDAADDLATRTRQVRREVRAEYRKAGVSRTQTKTILGEGSLSQRHSIKASPYCDPTRPARRADLDLTSLAHLAGQPSPDPGDDGAIIAPSLVLAPIRMRRKRNKVTTRKIDPVDEFASHL